MADSYQKGSDSDWLQHSNDELARLVRKRGRQIALMRFLVVVLLGLLAWVVYKFTQKGPIEELWKF